MFLYSVLNHYNYTMVQGDNLFLFYADDVSYQVRPRCLFKICKDGRDGGRASCPGDPEEEDFC